MATSLAAYLNLPAPVRTYNLHMKALASHARDQASESTSRAAAEVKEAQNSSDVRVSVDGTWQRRGFSSKQGVVTVLTNLGRHEANKVIDCEVLSKYCHQCTQLEMNDNVKLSTYKRGHVCSINHDGSAGAMETAGALKIFERSKAKHGLQYTEYLGDGDSKAFTDVAASNLYDQPIKKLECVGHIQKRMGKALMNVVEANKGNTFVVDRSGHHLPRKLAANRNRGERLYRGAGGADRLTKKAIKSIQGHYGAAIRSHTTVDEMREAIWAIYTHRKGDHSSCPEWCPSRRGDMDAANKHKLPAFICKLMQPVFERLSSQDLLERCVHGGTQNANESFHHIIWSYCPKEKFAGQKRIEFAVNVATMSFNDGERGLLPLFARAGLRIGKYHEQHAKAKDNARVKKAEQACTVRNKQKRQSAQINRSDTTSYEAGSFY